MGNMLLFLVRTPTNSIGHQQKTATQHFHDSLLSKEKPVQCLCSLTLLHLTSLHYTSQLSNQQSYHSTTCNGGSTTLLLCGDMVWQWQWHHGIHPCDVDQWAVGQEAAAPKNKLGGSCCSQKRLSMPFLGTITCLLNHSRNLQPPCCLLQREIRLLLMQTYSSFILAPLDQEWPMPSEHSTIALSFDSGLTVHQTSA